VLNHLDADSTLDIKTISEFLDVFPEEFPGMPLDREIGFVIELVLGTAPIFKRPYRMAANQLADLKEQLQEILDKGYIRLNTSPWEYLSFLCLRRMVHRECVSNTVL
jgi:hypothetical protein